MSLTPILPANKCFKYFVLYLLQLSYCRRADDETGGQYLHLPGDPLPLWQISLQVRYIHTAFSLVQSFRVLKYFHDFCYAIKLVLYDKKSRWTKIVQQFEALDQWDSSNVGARPIRMLYSGHSPPDTTPTSCSGDPMRCPPAFSTETQTVPIISCSGDSPAVIELL